MTAPHPSAAPALREPRPLTAAAQANDERQHGAGMTASPYTRTARRCRSPEGAPGHWQLCDRPTEAAMREAVAMDTGRPADWMAWDQLTRAWRGLRDRGWAIESDDEGTR